jgi:peptidyl-prolyl cis-trans isomerase SurA
MKKISNLIILLLLSVSMNAQDIMNVGKEKVSVSEFLKIYQKNNNSKQSYSKADLDEYIDLFTLFKMKLQEARAKRLDTLTTIREDYDRYTDQLVQNTMVDKNYVDNILRAQYEHMKSDVKIAHIMVKCAQNATPQDSILAYNKLKFIREKATAINFSDLAKENSEDKASSPQGGQLGFITAFMTFPDFEEQCFKTPVGQISQIFRTQFGYHIMHIIEKRPARGRIQVAHIYMKKTDDKADEMKMNDAYKEVSSKKISFEDAVKKYSQDASSTEKNGELPEFGVSEMVQDFEDQCFNLKNKGDISKPFKSDYGWHMVKLIEKKPLATYELSKDMIKQKLERDPRITNLRTVAYNQMVAKYKLNEEKQNLTNYTNGFVDTFFVKNNWELPSQKNRMAIPLFNFNNQSYLLSQFIGYANKNFNSATSRTKADVFGAMYTSYKEKSIWDATKAILSSTNEEYKSLESEYMNGLLIFEIMEKEVWKKAVNDTVGAKKLYEKEKNNYWYKERYVLEGIKTKNESLTTNYIASVGQIAPKKILDQIKKSKDSNDFVYYERTIEKGEIEVIDSAASQNSKSFKFTEDDKSIVVAKISKKLAPSIKPFNDIKGRIQNLYQTQLEKEWNASLRAKYPVQINQPELTKLIKN